MFVCTAFSALSTLWANLANETLIFFLVFPRKYYLTFHANCLLKKFSLNVKKLFSETTTTKKTKQKKTNKKNKQQKKKQQANTYFKTYADVFTEKARRCTCSALSFTHLTEMIKRRLDNNLAFSVCVWGVCVCVGRGGGGGGGGRCGREGVI